MANKKNPKSIYEEIDGLVEKIGNPSDLVEGFSIIKKMDDISERIQIDTIPFAVTALINDNLFKESSKEIYEIIKKEIPATKEISAEISAFTKRFKENFQMNTIENKEMYAILSLIMLDMLKQRMEYCIALIETNEFFSKNLEKNETTQTENGNNIQMTLGKKDTTSKAE